MSKRVVVAASCVLLVGLTFLGLAIRDTPLETEEPTIASLAEKLGLDPCTDSLEQIVSAVIERLPRFDQAKEVYAQALTLDGPFRRTERGVLAFKTLPYALCSIKIHYRATDADANDPELSCENSADANGLVMWSWDIGTNTAGSAIATLTVTPPGGTSSSQDFDFYVADPS